MTASTILITYNGVDDITNSVIYASATFETQMNAVPGTCSFDVRDPDRSLSFITGKELRLFIDGEPVWGGYIRRVASRFSFPADDTSVPATYTQRIWRIEGADYNILWDHRFLRKTSNYTSHLPDETGYDKSEMDGWAIWKMLYSFSDFPSGFGITATRADATGIDDVQTVLPDTATKNFFYKAQGTKLRDQMDEFAKMTGSVYYIGADKVVHYHAYESVIKRWGFSDKPNYASITASPVDYQSADWGFREVTAEEDGTMIVNDSLIWGGSAIGSSGDVIYARVTDRLENSYKDATGAIDDTSYKDSTTWYDYGDVATGSSIDTHGRWQVGEVHTEGGMYGNLKGVHARANAIVYGPPGTAAKDGAVKGLRYPQWAFSFTWNSWRVPTLSAVRDHIRAGDIVRVELETFGIAQYAPCRTLRIRFENLDPTGDAYAMFSGDFGYQYSDPITLWRTLLQANTTTSGSSTPVVSTAGDASVTSSYGAFGTFTPTPATDGVETVFDLPNDLGYITGSLTVYLNGLIQRPGIDYNETSGTNGTFTMTSAPVATDSLTVTCRTTAT